MSGDELVHGVVLVGHTANTALNHITVLVGVCANAVTVIYHQRGRRILNEDIMIVYEGYRHIRSNLVNHLVKGLVGSFEGLNCTIFRGESVRSRGNCTVRRVV